MSTFLKITSASTAQKYRQCTLEHHTSRLHCTRVCFICIQQPAQCPSAQCHPQETRAHRQSGSTCHQCLIIYRVHIQRSPQSIFTATDHALSINSREIFSCFALSCSDEDSLPGRGTSSRRATGRVPRMVWEGP